MRFTSLIIELIRARPRLVVWIVVLCQASLWLLVPLIFYRGPPGELATVVQNHRVDDRFLVAGGALARVIADGFADAPRQRAVTRVGEENFFARDGEFVAAQFFVFERFGYCHEPESKV